MTTAGVNADLETGRKVRGRKDREKQEAVANKDAVRQRIEHLVKLYHAHETATAELSEAIKATAEKSGLLASVVRKYVVAKAGDKFEDKQREAWQMAFLFGDDE